ncbi:GNAT family N-acetyltransferase [Candidatus Bealeia paramacronuclearis]|uniref:GNAT family N-acetyltransferase n=1 Tax=Candidatus Bealeia paramacronuclearis TaxID=1921001 RepID=A0ABZ2C229_9PROT|nr:GNAT family N-acetyltransferase [Candidatus Bealeia paramacronuclearis]
MAKFRFEKIVRDKVPQILEVQGIHFVQKELSAPEKIKALKDKLLEESQEVHEASSPQDLLEEIADVAEVLDAILAQSQITWEEVNLARTKKNEKSGAFQKSVYIKTVEAEDGHPLESFHYESPLKYPRLHSSEKDGIEIMLHENSFTPLDEEILKRLRDFNAPYFGSEKAQNFTLAAHENDVLIGGASGFIKQESCFLNVVFVDDSHRKKGQGQAFMKILEDFAKSKGCTKLDLETFEFQAPAFYEKIGFRVLTTTKNWLRGQTIYLMRKNLKDI